MKTIFFYLIIGLCVIGFFSIFYMADQQSWPEIQASLIKREAIVEEPVVEEPPIIEEPIEMIDDAVIIREVSKDLIAEKIEQGKEFLYRMERVQNHGFYKRYEAETDYLGDNLHTVYSASIIYTFLYINDYQEDKKILKNLPLWGDYLLSMQNKDDSLPVYGAFNYSYDWYKQEKEQRYVIGTAALSIFTLLRLHEATGEERFLESAKLAGDWILTMQRDDGVIKPYTRLSEEGKWVSGNKESLLYNGQCLSALSKLYAYTEIEKYYLAAEKIAKHFAEKYELAGRKYVVGEYRSNNPISNSWIVMSLMDFYKVNQDDYYKDIVFELSSQVIANQFKDPNDLLNYGRIGGAYSTSGNGWISEVMTDTYSFCLEQARTDCEKYKQTVVNITRWIIQYTYSENNSSNLKNPEKALGGVYWNKETKYVRTDSVCHALNGYSRIMKYLDDGLLVSIPKSF